MITRITSSFGKNVVHLHNLESDTGDFPRGQKMAGKTFRKLSKFECFLFQGQTESWVGLKAAVFRKC